MKIEIKEIIKDKNKPWDILKAVIAGNKKCKTCKKNEARNGSTYCKECADNYCKSLLK
jgi:hypothetical protein